MKRNWEEKLGEGIGRRNWKRNSLELGEVGEGIGRRNWEEELGRGIGRRNWENELRG